LAYTLTNFGEVYLAEGEYEAALDNWNAARELYAAMEDSHGLTETYLQLAQVYLMLEDRDLADEVLSEAEKLISEKKLDLFSGQLLYVKGLYLIAERTWDAALEALSASEKWYDEAGQAEKKWTSRVNIARCHLLRESPQEAVQVLEELLGGKQQPLSPQIEAEASYLMGELGKVAPTLVADKPLNYYKRGMQLIEKEPVTELTWKIAFALAREYHERGQNDRAAEFLLKTKAIVEYFLSNFRSNDLRNQYLLVDQKNRVLSTIEILTKR
jgi:tetratricopeptide (TPR) repeat protein